MALVLQNFGYFLVDEFQKAFVFLRKGVRGVGININLPHIFTINKYGNHNLGLHRNATGNVVVLGRYIGHNEILVANSNLTANTFSKRYDGMVGGGSCVWAQF